MKAGFPLLAVGEDGMKTQGVIGKEFEYGREKSPGAR